VNEGLFYRAWDTEEKRMYEVTALWWNAAIPGQIERMELVGAEQPFPTKIVYRTSGIEHFILMQGTGKMDRGGKVIYPGDIVLWCGGQYTITFSDNEGTWILKDDREDWDCPSLYGISSPLQSRIQIIGNIYETPSS
jgi:uncharacterized phage protein (TIGR01671 family)